MKVNLNVIVRLSVSPFPLEDTLLPEVLHLLPAEAIPVLS